MRQLKNVFAILTLIFTALFIACSDGNNSNGNGDEASGDTVVCTYYMKDDTSVYYVFYGDKTAEYHANGKIENSRSELIYSGNPLKAGTVSLKISLTGTELISFNVKESNGTLIPTVELVPGFPVEYTLTLDGENDNGENSGTDNESGMSGDSIVCTYYMKGDTSVYYVFYGDKTAEYHANGKIENSRSELIYSGNPLKAGTVSLKISLTGTELISFNVKKSHGTLIPTVELVPGFHVEYTLTLDGENDNEENSGTDNESSPLMFMGFDNVVTIEKGTDITGITNTIYSLTSDTTLKFKGGINSITLTTIAAAISTNDSVKIALDFSEATGITEWTNKLAGVKTLYAISLPSTVTSVQDEAFKECTNLKAITVPKSITEFPSVDSEIIVNLKMTLEDWLNASMKISGTQPLYLNDEEVSGEVIVPDGITTIRSGAFSNCPNLTKIVLPESVTSIESYAFANCGVATVASWDDYSYVSLSFTCGAQSLESINLENVTNIGAYAFAKCNSLREIHLSQIESVGVFAFYECSALTNVTINGCSHGETSIGDYAFHNCNGLMVVIFGNSIEYIGDYAFSCYPENGDNGGYNTVDIPDSVSHIGKNAFSKQGHIIITFGENTAERGEGWCSYAGLIQISGSSIPSNAFMNCNEITQIQIYENVTSIGSMAFYGCSGLTSITIPKGVKEIGYEAFGACTGLTSITLPDSITYAVEPFADYTNLTSIYYDGTLETYLTNNLGFRNNSSVDFYINNVNVTEITDVVIPNSVTTIGSYAFMGWENLTNVTIPDSVTIIGQFAFFKCTGLTNVTLPAHITEISFACFDHSGLTSITIPDGVTSIGSFAFDSCSSLTSITIPVSVTDIGNGAFYQVDNHLTTINYRGSEEQWAAINIDSDNTPLTTATIVYNYTGN